MYRGDIKQGFTLIELLVVLAIIAIFVTLSTPLSNIYRQNRVSTQVQEFVTALNIARNEAVSRGVPVSIVCIPSNQLLDVEGNPVLDENNNPVLTCQNSEGSIDWGAGWIAFTDTSPADCSLDTDAGDTVINRGNAMPSGFSMRVVGRNCINYTATGITPNTSGLWTLCDPST